MSSSSSQYLTPQNLNMPEAEEPLEEISPAADEAMRKLVELFSDPAIAAQARFRCSTEGPDDMDVLFESILDDQFGYDPNSIPSEWGVAWNAGVNSPA